MKEGLKYIYGPVYSWRLGMSLGIDPIANKDKVCNMDCVYCQLGKTHHWSNKRKVYVSARRILDEINTLLPLTTIDYFTFSGRGEPTLAKNLGTIIHLLKETKRKKIAVITNSTLIHQKDVQEDLLLADYVIAKLDACDQGSFQNVDHAVPSVDFDKIVGGIKSFRQNFQGKLAIQIMFIEKNKDLAAPIADIAREIHADEVQINTPLRPSASKPLSKEELDKIKGHFVDMPAVTAYEKERKIIDPIDEQDTFKRHGNFKKQL